GSDQTRKLLVLGGSQGAQFLNETLPALVDALRRTAADKALTVRHQAGRGKAEMVRERYRALDLEATVDEFIDDMPAAYDDADFVICRAGALTISELTVAGRPALFVPFPHAADDHQTKNAAAMVAAGAALMVAQPDFDVARVADTLRDLLWPGKDLAEMGAKARELGKPKAVDAIVDGCLELLA
ncbi:MAG: UDP-N-acetylglucosamine--N-acetylmuramyl-(pentapeptide) pyrophosphoryl-undecaprenol N-acetylglucosamine transferase, partial [Myxococcales bacterium]|nr:UDP-N-acetylglucosamine--N-acetylmuramyl-(pentapeptide) pyrophosphoryl-undecaprenol N-acetylglucosamine transferase [Myxococcales bacterium]